MRFLSRILLAFALAGGWVSQIAAHPHEFVTMKIVAQFDDDGRMRGFLYNWSFDPFFTAYAVEGEDLNKDGKAQQHELDGLLAHILENIKKINYFTAFDANGVVPEFASAKPIAAELDGQNLVLTFDLQFKEPVDVKAKPLRYAIYDDEFYISMTHDPEKDAVELVGAPAGCSFNLDEAEPSDEIAEFAASLGKNESGGSGLGVQFAEWVTITCS